MRSRNHSHFPSSLPYIQAVHSGRRLIFCKPVVCWLVSYGDENEYGNGNDNGNEIKDWPKSMLWYYCTPVQLSYYEPIQTPLTINSFHNVTKTYEEGHTKKINLDESYYCLLGFLVILFCWAVGWVFSNESKIRKWQPYNFWFEYEFEYD